MIGSPRPTAGEGSGGEGKCGAGGEKSGLGLGFSEPRQGLPMPLQKCQHQLLEGGQGPMRQRQFALISNCPLLSGPELGIAIFELKKIMALWGNEVHAVIVGGGYGRRSGASDRTSSKSHDRY